MDESVVLITTVKKTDLLYGYTSIHLPSFPSSIHIDFIPESSEYVGNLFPSGHLTGKWLKQTSIAGYHWHGFARVKSTLQELSLHWRLEIGTCGREHTITSVECLRMRSLHLPESSLGFVLNTQRPDNTHILFFSPVSYRCSLIHL